MHSFIWIFEMSLPFIFIVSWHSHQNSLSINAFNMIAMISIVFITKHCRKLSFGFSIIVHSQLCFHKFALLNVNLQFGCTENAVYPFLHSFFCSFTCLRRSTSIWLIVFSFIAIRIDNIHSMCGCSRGFCCPFNLFVFVVLDF